jgi:hypothetical protein
MTMYSNFELLYNRYLILETLGQSREPKEISKVRAVDIKTLDICVIEYVAKDQLHYIRSCVVQPGIKFNYQSELCNEILHHYIQKNDLDMVKTLVEMGSRLEGVFIDRKGPPLKAAIWWGTPEMVKYLLEQGAKLDRAEINYGVTPLHVAIQNRKLEIAELMLQQGADINALANYMGTPLSMSLMEIFGAPHFRVADFLLDHGADINARAYLIRGDTCLHRAVRWRAAHVVEYLVRHRADSNIKNDEGETAVHLAVTESNEYILRLVLKYHGDANIPNSRGETALDLTRKNKKTYYVEIIKQYEMKHWRNDEKMRKKRNAIK